MGRQIKIEMDKRQETLLTIIAIVVTVSLALTYSFIASRTGELDDSAHTPTLFMQLLEQTQQQIMIDEWMLDELSSGEYSIDSPLIVVNPYGNSPLTALTLFVTDEPMRSSVVVVGETDDASIGFNFEDYRTKHIIPILGLYPQRQNTIELNVVSAGGETKNVELTIETEALPESFADIEIIFGDENTSLDRLYTELFFTHGTMSAFDENGDIRWLFTERSSHDYPTVYLDNGNFIVTLGRRGPGDHRAFELEVNKFGRIITIYSMHEELEGLYDGQIERRVLYSNSMNDIVLGIPTRFAIQELSPDNVFLQR